MIASRASIRSFPGCIRNRPGRKPCRHASYSGTGKVVPGQSIDGAWTTKDRVLAEVCEAEALGDGGGGSVAVMDHGGDLFEPQRAEGPCEDCLGRFHGIAVALPCPEWARAKVQPISVSANCSHQFRPRRPITWPVPRSSTAHSPCPRCVHCRFPSDGPRQLSRSSVPAVTGAHSRVRSRREGISAIWRPLIEDRAQCVERQDDFAPHLLQVRADAVPPPAGRQRSDHE